jgi:hypothetical protein
MPKPKLAFNLAQRLNTEPRRDRAIENLIKEQLSSPIRKLQLEEIRKELAVIINPDIRDALIEDIWSRPFVSKNDAALRQLLASVWSAVTSRILSRSSWSSFCVIE